MDKVFIGFDPRQPIAFSVLSLSIVAQASRPISVTPLVLQQLPITRTGLTQFTYSRFLVPWLCDYQGRALFVDADMVANGDICELFDLADDQYAVMTAETTPAFERAATMLFNCGHPDNKRLTPEFVQHCSVPLHKIAWTKARGTIPNEWNHLVLYDEPREDAKLVHFTGGLPCFPETMGNEHTNLWRQWADMARSTVSWKELMGNSVHRNLVLEAQTGT